MLLNGTKTSASLLCLFSFGFVACEAVPVITTGSSTPEAGIKGSSSGDSDRGAIGQGGSASMVSGVASLASSDSLGVEGSCAESEEKAKLVPANLLFVVDKSGSMKCNAPPADTSCSSPIKLNPDLPSKWESTQAALTGDGGALKTLAGQTGVSAGLMLFPLDDSCQVTEEGEYQVDLAPLTQSQLTDISQGLNQEPSGQTPLAGAAIRGLEALRISIQDEALAGDNYLVLMTDGSETCQPAAITDLLTYVREAEEYYNIKTYVIGAPGSEGSRSLLSQIAVAGGTQRDIDCLQEPNEAREACHIDLTQSQDFATDLGREFAGITEETTQTCEYDVPANALVDKSKVNVEFTNAAGEVSAILQDPREKDAEQCSDAEGWQFSEDGTKIILCGNACDDVLANTQGQVQVVFGCRETLIR